MRRWLILLWLAFLPAIAVAQEVLVVDLDRAYALSSLGQSLEAQLRASQQAVQDENDRVAEELKAEEAALTELRATVTPEEFRAKADAFNQKVSRLREERDSEEVALQKLAVELRGQFLDQIGSKLQQIVADRGASVVLNRRTAGVMLATPAADATDDLIAAINAGTP